MLSDNVDVYYVLNQRKVTLCNVFWTLNVWSFITQCNCVRTTLLSYFARL